MLQHVIKQLPFLTSRRVFNVFSVRKSNHGSMLLRCMLSTNPTPSAKPEGSASSQASPILPSQSTTNQPVNTETSTNSNPTAKLETNRGPISWTALILLLGAGSAAVVYYNLQRASKKAEVSSKVEAYGTASLGGPWSLVDSTGRPMTSGDLLGQYYLIYFGFTACPEICPTELVKVSQAVDLLEKRNPRLPRILPVFVTLDPARDSCAVVGAYVHKFHPRMIGLTGTPGQIANIAKKFRVYFSEVDKADEDSDYLVDHSIVTYLMSPEGDFMEFYTQIVTAPEMAERLAATIEKHERKNGRNPSSSGSALSAIQSALGIGNATARGAK